MNSTSKNKKKMGKVVTGSTEMMSIFPANFITASQTKNKVQPVEKLRNNYDISCEINESSGEKDFNESGLPPRGPTLPPNLKK